MFTDVTGLIYKDQSMTEMTVNKEQRKDYDKREYVEFTGHKA